jgi:hypothetical protein
VLKRKNWWWVSQYLAWVLYSYWYKRNPHNARGAQLPLTKSSRPFLRTLQQFCYYVCKKKYYCNLSYFDIRVIMQLTNQERNITWWKRLTKGNEKKTLKNIMILEFLQLVLWIYYCKLFRGIKRRARHFISYFKISQTRWNYSRIIRVSPDLSRILFYVDRPLEESCIKEINLH